VVLTTVFAIQLSGGIGVTVVDEDRSDALGTCWPMWRRLPSMQSSNSAGTRSGRSGLTVRQGDLATISAGFRARPESRTTTQVVGFYNRGFLTPSGMQPQAWRCDIRAAEAAAPPKRTARPQLPRPAGPARTIALVNPQKELMRNSCYGALLPTISRWCHLGRRLFQSDRNSAVATRGLASSGRRRSDRRAGR